MPKLRILAKTKRMKPSSQGFILNTGSLNEVRLSYLTHNPLVSQSSKPDAGYSDYALFTSDLVARPHNDLEGPISGLS